MTTEQLNHFWSIVDQCPKPTPQIAVVRTTGGFFTVVVEEGDIVDNLFGVTFGRDAWNDSMHKVDGIFVLNHVESRLRRIKRFRAWLANNDSRECYYITGKDLTRISKTDEGLEIDDNLIVTPKAVERLLLTNYDMLIT